MTTPTKSEKRELVEIKFGGAGSFHQYITNKRAAGESWATIAGDLEQRHGLDVSDQTLINWFGG